jgi:hypothetical protein
MKFEITKAYSESIDGKDSEGRIISIQIFGHLLQIGKYKVASH